MGLHSMTISEVAKEAGVSKTTISRYLNGKYEFMSPQTKERIQSVIERTGYQPNSAARSLKNRKSMLIGLLTADIESPFSSAAIKGVSDVLNKAGYHVISASSDNSPEKEEEIVRSLLRQQVDGLIINAADCKGTFWKSVSDKVPTVLLDRLLDDNSFDCACIENKSSIENAVEHLKNAGYGRIALITEDYKNISPRTQRREAFLNAVGEDADVFVVDHEREDSVENALCRLMTKSRNDEKPPAVIASNGVTMIRCVKSVRDLGLKMPSDLGLCGYDDWGMLTSIGLAAFVDVGITTFAANVGELGREAAEMLLERIDGEYDGEARIKTIPTELIARESTNLKK